MAGTGVIVCALLIAAAALGLAAYEAMLRYAAPGIGKPWSNGRGEGFRGGKESGGSSNRRLRGNFLEPLGRALDRFAPLSRSDVETCRDRLNKAGLGLEPETWRSIRAVCAVGFGGLAGSVAAGIALSPPALACAAVCGAAFGWAAPSLELSRRANRRRRDIELRLPDAMELLGIAIAAGSPVEQCFREVAASMDGPLAQEFSLVDQEVNLLGHSREEALEHLGRRCCSQDVSAFVAQMTQAVSQGSSISDGLAMQAALARETAQAEAMERIRKMPTKLDIVLSFCFLPPTVALVVVPTVVNLLDFLNNSMG